MKVPPWLYRGRDAIEGLIPRDGAVSAVTHIAAGALGTAGVALGMGMMHPDVASNPDENDKAEYFRSIMSMLPLAVAPLFLTAGMQLATPAGHALARGANPFYFLSAGALIGAFYITKPVAEAYLN